MRGYLKSGKNTRVDLAWWRDQIKAGENFRKRYAHEQRWPEWRKYYRGDWDLTKTMPSAIFFRMLRTIVPRVYFRNPSISIQAAQPGIDNWAFAQLVERIDNKMLRLMGVKKQMKKIAQNSFLFGTGIGKLGFGAQYTPSPEQEGRTETPVDRHGGKSEYNSLVFPNMPWFMSTHTGNFIVPAGVANLEDSPWVAEFIRRPYHEVKADPRYKTNDLNPTKLRASNFVGMDGKTLNYQQPEEMLEMYEVRDKRTGLVFVISFNAGGNHENGVTLLEPEPDYLQYANRINYYESIFNDDDEVFWGVPDSVHLEPHQLEMNEIRTAAMYHRRMSIRKIFGRKNALSPAEQDKLLSSDPFAYVEVDGSPYTDLMFKDVGDIPEGLTRSQMEVMQQIREDLGFSRNEFGDVGPANSRTTKFESQVAKMAVEIRVDERRDALADMLVNVVKDMHRILFNEWQTEQVVEVMGPAGIPLWVQFKPDMIDGYGFEVKVDPDTSLPQTREMRESKAVKTFELLKANPLIDPYRLTRYLLHEMHGVHFDDMIRGIPMGMGANQKPLSIEQYIQLVQTVAQQAPQALPGPGQQSQPIEGELV